MKMHPLFCSVVLVWTLGACSSLPEGTPPPLELAGAWSSGAVSAVDYYDRTTHSWSPPNGSGSLLRFSNDGSFTYNTLGQFSSSFCNNVSTTYYTGVVVFEGNQFTIYPEYTRHRYESSCDASLNSDREIENELMTATWRLQTGYSGETQLVANWSDGREVLYTRP